jgi:hypothetical protein
MLVMSARSKARATRPPFLGKNKPEKMWLPPFVFGRASLMMD